MEDTPLTFQISTPLPGRRLVMDQDERMSVEDIPFWNPAPKDPLGNGRAFVMMGTYEIE